MQAPDLPARYTAVLESRRDDVAQRLTPVLASAAGPIVWEVGCGHGHFLTAYGAAHRDRLCIGVDIESQRIERAEKKRQRARLHNVHFIRAEARLFLQALPPTAPIQDVFILFPDPWPKSRHHKHRLLQAGFLAQLAAHTTRDAQIYFRTDHQEYFLEARSAIEESSYWRLTDAPWPFEHATVFQNRAERHESFVARKRGAHS